jgi:hypothetical protein
MELIVLGKHTSEPLVPESCSFEIEIATELVREP